MQSVEGGGRRQCPAYIQICSHCHKLRQFARVFRSRWVQQRTTSTVVRQTSANTIQLGSQDKATEQVQLYNIGSSKAKPAPAITVQISSSKDMKDVKVLPNSGADISTAEQKVMRHLGQHKDNLLPSQEQ